MNINLRKHTRTASISEPKFKILKAFHNIDYDNITNHHIYESTYLLNEVVMIPEHFVMVDGWNIQQLLNSIEYGNNTTEITIQCKHSDMIF